MPDDWGMGPTSGGGGAAATSGGGGAFTDWLKENAGWLATLGQLGVGAYTATKQPSYHQVPLSPEQSALYQRYLKAFDNPATKYNAGIASDLSRSELGRIGPTLPWNRTSPMSMAYQGLTPPTLQPSGIPQGTNADYYNNLIKQSVANQKAWEGQSGTAAPAAPTGGGENSPGGDAVSGDPFGHIGAPADSSGDPFAGLPTGSGASTGQGGGLAQVGSWLAQHPEITKLGVNGIAALIGSVFGLPGAIAAKFAASWLSGKMGQQYTGNPNPSGAWWTTVDANGNEIKPRENWTPTTIPEQHGQQFIGNQNNNVANNPGDVRPENMGGNVMPWPSDTIPMGPAGRRKFF